MYGRQEIPAEPWERWNKVNITLSPPVLSGIEWHEVLTGKWTVTIAEAPRYTRLGGPSTLRGVPTVGLVRAAPPPSTRRHIRLLIEEAFAKLPKRRKKERKASRLIHSPAGLAVREETDRNIRSLCLCDPVGLPPRHWGYACSPRPG